MMAVPLTATQTGLRVRIPVALFPTRLDVVRTSFPGQYSVSADGQRFLIKLPIEESAAPPMTVVMNWAAALKN
jgi:hypothetical protein